MTDEVKTKEDLISEVVLLRRHIAELENAESERGRAQEALRESEERYRRLFEDAVLGIFQSTPAGKLITVNPSYARMFGFDSPEEVKRLVNDVAIDLYANPVRRSEVLRMILESERPIRVENLYKRKDGSVFIGNLYAWSVRDRDGKFLHLEGFVEDISDRKRAEEALREAERKYRSIFENAREGIYQATPDGHYLTANPAMAKIYGYSSPEEMIAGIESIDHEIYVIPQKRSELKRLLTANGEVKDFEVQQRRKDGSTFWVSLTAHAVYAEDGSILFWEGRSVDITERKEAEEALRQSEERLSLSLEATEDGVWDWDIPTGCAIFSPRWYRMLGYEPYEFPQSYDSWRSLLHPDDIDRTEREIKEYIASGEGYAIEIRMRTKTGAWRWILTRGKVVERDADGRPVRMVGTHSDITERKRVQEEKERLEEQFLQAQKMESVGRLAGGVAHDFNNMLGVIIGHSELALDHIDPVGPLYQSLREIQKAAQRSADLTRQLLAFARKQTISPKVLDLNDTVSGMLKMLRRLIGEDIELTWTPGRDIWKVRFDPSQIDQILANLAVNAHDAISGVGSIALKTENVAIVDSNRTVNPELVAGEYVLLTVSDTGGGMSREVLEHVFEPFFTTKEVGKGTGLGLATVYGIVRQNNGYIDVESWLGKGTAFKIYLPRFVCEVSEISLEEAGDGLQQGTETILVVEDDEAILQLAKTILEGLGYTVIAKRSPDEAVRSVEEHAGDLHLLITDVVMPQMNGRELANRLCAIRPDLKVLYMSGYTDDVIAHRGALDDGLHFIPKPFSRSDLAAITRAVLEQT